MSIPHSDQKYFDAGNKSPAIPNDISNESEMLANFESRRNTSTRKSGNSSYEGLRNIFWSNRRVKQKRTPKSSLQYSSSSKKSNMHNKNEKDVSELAIHRAQSFNSDVVLDSDVADIGGTCGVSFSRNLSNADSFFSSERYKTSSDNLRRSSVLSDTDDNLTDCSADVLDSCDLDLHPEHKVYKKVKLSKNSLKNILKKLTTARQTLLHLQDGIPRNDSFDQSPSHMKVEKNIRVVPSYSLKPGCKTRKNIMKRAKSDDELDRELFSDYQLGTKIMGAKIAENKINSIYRGSPNADPTVQNAALSTVKMCAGESSWKHTDAEALILANCSSSSEEDLTNSGLVCEENYYEKTFQKMEELLQDDIYRDSAIYSDPEDIELKISAADVTKHFPSNILDRVTKSPSFKIATSSKVVSPIYTKSSESFVQSSKCEFKMCNNSVFYKSNEVTGKCYYDENMKLKPERDSPNVHTGEQEMQNEITKEKRILLNTKLEHVTPITSTNEKSPVVSENSIGVILLGKDISLQVVSDTSTKCSDQLTYCASDDMKLPSYCNKNSSESSSPSVKHIVGNLNCKVNNVSEAKKVPPPVPKKPVRKVHTKLLNENIRNISSREIIEITDEISNLSIRNEICEDSLNRTLDCNGYSSRYSEVTKTVTESSKPPQSPMNSIRCFTNRKVSQNTSTRNSFRRAQSEKREIRELKICEGSSDEVSTSSSGRFNLSRKRSIKAIGSMLGGKLRNNRSSSVPPKLETEKKTSLSSLDCASNYQNYNDSETDSPVFKRKKKLSKRLPKPNNKKTNSQQNPESTQHSSLCHDSMDSLDFKDVPKMKNSFEAKTAAEARSSRLKARPSEVCRKEASCDEREIARPKGWVRQVVGRLQEQ